MNKDEEWRWITEHPSLCNLGSSWVGAREPPKPLGGFGGFHAPALISTLPRAPGARMTRVKTKLFQGIPSQSCSRQFLVIPSYSKGRAMHGFLDGLIIWYFIISQNIPTPLRAPVIVFIRYSMPPHAFQSIPTPLRVPILLSFRRYSMLFQRILTPLRVPILLLVLRDSIAFHAIPTPLRVPILLLCTHYSSVSLTWIIRYF